MRAPARDSRAARAWRLPATKLIWSAPASASGAIPRRTSSPGPARVAPVTPAISPRENGLTKSGSTRPAVRGRRRSRHLGVESPEHFVGDVDGVVGVHEHARGELVEDQGVALLLADDVD